MSKLFDAENSDSDGELKINSDYANNYNSWRQKEELNKLKTKYGELENDPSNETSSSESSSDDEEDKNELTEQFDKDFYKTLACLKSKDPRIYDEGISFFKNTNEIQESKEKESKSTKKPKKEKALYLRDYERKIMLERDGKYSDSEDEDIIKKEKEASKKITYVQEQKKLKDSFKHILEDEEVADDTELLKPKIKSMSEKEKEEADYKEWLKGQQLEIDDNEKKDLQPLRDFWNNPNLDTNEKFLRDYILSNKFLDKDSSNVDLDYEQVIHDSDENLSEDEKNIVKQEEFEYKYNYRFEEPDQEFIKRYPRTMENCLRKKDTRRAQKRAEVKQRKEEDKLRKMEELKQLKALKRKEIEEKIEKLKEITGNDDIKFNEVDLDGDFDPNEHDRKMTEMFNEEYYNTPGDDMKPEFPEIDEELEIERTWDNYNPAEEILGGNDNEDYNGPHCEDEDFIMDADYDPSKTAAELGEGTKKRKRRRRSKFAEMLAKEKPKYDPQNFSSYEEYCDKYYSLDYEDMIGDLPCRFKYRKVVPNDYGLSVEEILMADDRELNKWCSLKRALQYKPEHVELNEVRIYKQKAANDALKRKILPSLYKNPEEENDETIQQDADQSSAVNNENVESKKKRKRKKKLQGDVGSAENSVQPNVECNGISDAKEDEVMVVQNGIKSGKAKKRKQKKEDSEHPIVKKLKAGNVEESKSNTENTQKTKKKKKAKQFASNSTKVQADVNENVAVQSNNKLLKKKDKHKKFGKANKANSKHKDDRGTNNDIASLNPERLKTYGINPKKLKNKLKYGKKPQ